MNLCNLCPRLPRTPEYEAHEIKKGLWAQSEDLETLEENESRGVGEIFQGEIKKKKRTLNKGLESIRV